MRKFGTLAATAAAMVLCFSASQAFAGFTAVGTPRLDNSWIQAFVADNLNAFDTIVIDVTPLPGWSDIENPAGTNFQNYDHNANATWSQPAASTGSGPNLGFLHAVFTGSSLNTTGTKAPGADGLTGTSDDLNFLQIDMHFTKLPQNGVDFFARMYSGGTGGTLVETDHIIITQTIPLPAAAYAGLTMLAGMGAFMLKRRRNLALLA